MRRISGALVICAAASFIHLGVAQAPKPKHISRLIELLEQGQPIYYTGSHSGTTGTFEQGKQDAQTWADNAQLRHGTRFPFDVAGLAEYMKGLAAGEPDEERSPHTRRDRQRSRKRYR